MSLPNALTLYRILILIPFVGLFYVPGPWGNWGTVLLFLSACITDFFDGYLARLRGQVSKFGKALDPIADKLLVATALLMLSGMQHIQGIHLIPAVIILCREVLVSGLREFLTTLDVRLPVTKLAKLKTIVQMTAISCLLVYDIELDIAFWRSIGLALLWASAVFTLITGYDYLKSAVVSVKKGGIRSVP